jgi:mono/diheme cytochrome c family protein
MKPILASCRPIKLSWVALVAAAGLVLPVTAAKAQTPGAASQATSPMGNPKNGGELYLKYSCYACHGYSGQNGPGTRLVPTRMTVPVFTAYVRNPRQMPPYTAKVVPDAQLADIWAYLQTLPRSPLPKDIPLLTQILNEK